MPITRVGPKHQITIPKEVFEAAQLEVGDILYATAENGKVMLTPEHLADKVPAVKFSGNERRALTRAQKKIKAMNEDLINSRGLTRNEAEVAAKADLIDKNQIWFWLEEWQKGEREAERDIRDGNLSPVFDNADDAIAYLRQEKGTA